MTIEDIELSHGFSAGNYANAYESTDMTTALAGHDHGDHNPDSPAYHSGFVLGFFSSYESHEIPCDAADTHEAALSTHGPLARKLGLIDTEGTGDKS